MLNFVVHFEIFANADILEDKYCNVFNSSVFDSYCSVFHRNRTVISESGENGSTTLFFTNNFCDGFIGLATFSCGCLVSRAV